MVNLITEGIEITVETFYQAQHSNPIAGEFVFAYHIKLSNHNTFAIRLLSRQWYIFDSNGERHQVEGDGVIGQQPIIPSGADFEYVSSCSFTTEMGKMLGYYTMENLNDKSLFDVKIPPFEMTAPSKLN